MTDGGQTRPFINMKATATKTTLRKQPAPTEIPLLPAADYTTEIYERFVHVVTPSEGSPTRVQVITEEGKLRTVKCSPEIYRRVLGTRAGENGNRADLGLRKLTRVKFRGHKDETDTLRALDLIPNRMFTSGAAPRQAGVAQMKGFDIHIDEELNGFDVWSEDTQNSDPMRINEPLRVAYAGLSERKLCDLLDALRKSVWGERRSLELLGHKFEKVEEGLIRCRPLTDVKYTT